MGRKIFDGKDVKEVIAKCKEVWAIGGTDAEASFYADISKDCISRYLKANEDVRNYRDRLREKPILKARKTITDNLDKPETAKWYIERKRRNEFATKKEEEMSGDIKISWEGEDKKDK